MKKKILLVPLAVLLLSAMMAPAMAEPLLVGVQSGDWFKYEARVTRWESTDPFLPEGYFGPLSLADNETNFILYTVADVTPGDGGANVTFDITYDWVNGSVTYGMSVENVSTANTVIFMIGANMSAGDMVSDAFDFYGTPYPARYINETIDLVNPNATRPTNVLEYTIELMTTPYYYLMYWDKATGMRVYYENSGDVPAFMTAAYNYTVAWSLVDSSVDGLLVPDLTGPLLLLTSMAITIPIALLHRRRKAIHLK